MKYNFPNIYDIDDVLWAIEGRPEFVVAEREGYTVINYNVMMTDTFPPIEGEIEDCIRAATRRECRGIIFDNETGKIIRRPFHKFFNANEREETQHHAIDLTTGHGILEKLDGSMIAPFCVDSRMIWGTKMGDTDVAKPVQEFVTANPQYEKFALTCMEGEPWLPIFEWCSRKQRIVIDHPEDKLILTAMRHLTTGKYASYAQLVNAGGLYGIPVVRRYDSQTDMKAFIEYVADLKDTEGFVVRFDDGHMVKLKCDWYVEIHKAKEKILQDRNIVELILDQKLDDVKSKLSEEEQRRLNIFENQIAWAIACKTTEVIGIIYRLRSHGIVTNKDYALSMYFQNSLYFKSIIFKYLENGELVYDAIRNDICDILRKNLSKTVKYEAIRDAWFPGVTYND